MLFTYKAHSSEGYSWACNVGIIRANDKKDAERKVLLYLKGHGCFYDYGFINITLQDITDDTNHIEIDNNGY